MPSSPPPPYPPTLDVAQYDLLWQVVYKGKILLIDHGAAQQPLVQRLLAFGYLEGIPRCRTEHERAKYDSRQAQAFDALAAIPRADWPDRLEEAAGLVSEVQYCRRQLIEADYHVTEAGRALVRAWEEEGRPSVVTPSLHLCLAPKWGKYARR